MASPLRGGRSAGGRFIELAAGGKLGVQRGNAQLARRVLAGLALIRGEDLLALLVEEEMIVAEVRAGHMPMEISGFK
jgi:hypothetical protein